MANIAKSGTFLNMDVQDPCFGKDASLPSRRTFIGSIGLLAISALPNWSIGTSSTQDIVVVDGWVLATTDLR